MQARRLFQNKRVGVGELVDIDDASGQEFGVTRLVYSDLPDHLPHDDLDVFVGDVDSLEPVDRCTSATR